MIRNHPDFAAEAERHRLAGDARSAREIAEAGLDDAPNDARGRIVLALALIDLGDLQAARTELAAAFVDEGSTFDEAIADVAPGTSFDGALGDDELESAFAQAESHPEEMMDANRVVEQALRAAELDNPEMDFDVTNRPTYATESMASLLDEQGRRAEASALREALSSDGADARASIPHASDWDEAGVGPDHAKRLRVVATLEGWLHNLKRQADHDARLRARGTGAAVGGTA